MAGLTVVPIIAGEVVVWREEGKQVMCRWVGWCSPLRDAAGSPFSGSDYQRCPFTAGDTLRDRVWGE